MAIEIINGRYVDEKALVKLLGVIFHNSNESIEYKVPSLPFSAERWS